MSAYETDKAMELVRRLATERQLTLLFCEHDMSAVFSTARTVTVMHQGRGLTAGTADQGRRNPDVQQGYLREAAEDELGASDPIPQGARKRPCQPLPASRGPFRLPRP